MWLQRKMVLGLGVGIAVIAGVAALALELTRPSSHAAASGPAESMSPPEEEEGEATTVAIRTIRPKRDPSLGITVEQPAYVEAYYRADLQARVAGPVKFIQKDKGDPVADQERLAEIDAPDLVQDVAEKEAIIEQRRRELELAEKSAKMAAAGVRVAEHVIQKQEADVATAEAERVYRLKECRRFQQLAKEKAVTASIVEEREKYYQAAEAATASARASVVKARSDLEEARAKEEMSLADVKLKRALIGVAEKIRDRAQAFLDLATVRAPFDGVIVGREAGPGSFVHSASTGHTRPVFTVERTDIVTIFMKVPDNYAAFVTRDTEAILEMTELPGQLIHAKVTRFSPCLKNPEHDRTMRVEVDLYNRSDAEHQRFLEKEKQTARADLKGGLLPVFPRVTGGPGGAPVRPLLPGMYGKMKLVLRSFQNAFLLPSNAVISHGGRTFIYEVKDGKVHPVAVEVQVDDGTVAKVTRIVKVGREEVKQDLTGEEEIILSNQGELSDGQEVKTVAVDW